MRRTAPLLAPLLLLAAAVPAAAQQPTPAATGTPPPDARCSEVSVLWPRSAVRPGEPFEVSVLVTDGSRPDLSLVRRSPEPVEVLRETPSATSTTWTLSLPTTSVLGVRAARQPGCAVDSSTSRVVVLQPAHADPACPTVAVRPVGPVDAGRPVVLDVGIDSPSATNTVVLYREQPGPATTVREAVVVGRAATFTVRLGETHRLRAAASYGQHCLGGQQAVLTVPVRPALTLGATRTAPRDYAFTGRVVPARGQALALYRVDDDGRRVLTARGRVRPDGTFRIDRRFLASGRFGLSVSVGVTSAHLAGASPVRPTVVH